MGVCGRVCGRVCARVRVCVCVTGPHNFHLPLSAAAYFMPCPASLDPVAHAGYACEAKFASSSCLLLYSIFHATSSCYSALLLHLRYTLCVLVVVWFAL